MDLFKTPLDTTPGYWGKRTSAVDWCEPNYTWSYYIAEFFNTITSLPAAVLAFYGVYLCYKYGYEKRMIVANLLIATVGLGSAAFHGTLLWTGQIFDELPMVYTCLCFLYIVTEFEAKEKPVSKYMAPGLLLYSALFTGVYLFIPSFFIFFLIGFILGVLSLCYHGYRVFSHPNTVKSQKVFIVLAIAFYIGGWLGFWVPEVAACERLRAFNFHSLWHVTSTFGCFFLMLFAIYQREFHRGRNPQLNYNYFMGVPIYPYIHIPTPSTKKELEDSSNSTSNESVILKKVAKKKNALSNDL